MGGTVFFGRGLEWHIGSAQQRVWSKRNGVLITPSQRPSTALHTVQTSLHLNEQVDKSLKIKRRPRKKSPEEKEGEEEEGRPVWLDVPGYDEAMQEGEASVEASVEDTGEAQMSHDTSMAPVPTATPMPEEQPAALPASPAPAPHAPDSSAPGHVPAR